MFFIAPVANADVQVSAPYAMVLSDKEMESLFSKLSFTGTESQKLEDFLIEQPFKTHLENISMVGSYDARVSSGASALDFVFSAKMSGVSLHVGKISTDSVIDRIVGGIHVQIFLKGQCENVVIKSLDIATLTTGVRFQLGSHGIEPVMGSLDLSTLPQWQIDMGKCQGPLGYDKALLAEIKNILSNKTEVQKIISNPIKSKVQSVVAGLNSKVFAPQEMPIAGVATVRIVPQSLELASPSAFIMKGTATAIFKSPTQENIAIDDVAFLTKSKTASTTGFYLSQKWIHQSIAKAQNLGLIGYSFKSSAVESLKSLFSSRLYQFFLWPDLMRFSKSAEFLFDFKVTALERLSFLYTSGDALWYDVQAKGKVKTQAPEKKGYVHYGDFSASLKSRVWVKLHKGIAVIGGYQPSFGLGFIWDSLYLKLFRPTQGISSSYFARKIESTLKDERYTLTLPSLDVSEDVKMRAEMLSGDGVMVIVRYSPVSQ